MSESLTMQVKTAVKEALDEYFTKIGVDVKRPLEMQADFRFLREKRTGFRKLILAVVTGIATSGATAAAAIVWHSVTK